MEGPQILLSAQKHFHLDSTLFKMSKKWIFTIIVKEIYIAPRFTPYSLAPSCVSFRILVAAMILLLVVVFNSKK